MNLTRGRTRAGLCRAGAVVVLGASLLGGVAGQAAASTEADQAAAVAPGYYSINFYRGSDVLWSQSAVCPPPSEHRRVVNLPAAARGATVYSAVGDCKLTAFRESNGSGAGVGLRRDGRRYGLGAVAGHVYSVAAYGR